MRPPAVSYVERVGAGRSAHAQYRARYRAWRSRTRLVVLLAALPVPLLTLGAALVFPVDRGFLLGLAVGSTVTFTIATTLLVPEHIDRWRRGAEAERQTAKALRVLSRRGWIIEHDLPGRYGNRDHVAIAPCGAVFLLDTKAPGGTITVQRGVIHVSWLEDPTDGYEQHLNPRMRAAAAGLADELGRALPKRPWVTPVVVIWGRWPGLAHSHDGVAWVPGPLLAERLHANAGAPDHEKQQQIAQALRQCGAEATARSKPASRDTDPDAG